MVIDEYRDKINTILNEMTQDPDISHDDCLGLTLMLAENCLQNIDKLAGAMSTIMKEAIGVYRR